MTATDARRGRLVPVVAALAALALAGCDFAPIPGEGPLRYRDEIFDDTTRTADVVYGEAVDQDGDTVTLRLDVYEPEGDTVAPRPLVVWVHGGSFRAGDKRSPEIVDQATTFARKGYVSASISYRLSDNGCTVPNAECVQAILDARADAQAAVRFLRDHAGEYGIDGSRVAIAGTSAGAITALGVAYATEPGDDARVGAAVSLSGALIFNGEVDEDDPHTLLFHGTADNVVPYSWATDTARAAWTDGVPGNLISWEGDGHVPYVAHRTQIINLTTNFLYRMLDAGAAAQ